MREADAVDLPRASPERILKRRGSTVRKATKGTGLVSRITNADAHQEQNYDVRVRFRQKICFGDCSRAAGRPCCPRIWWGWRMPCAETCACCVSAWVGE